MIVLDTNVVSETLQPVPDERVMAWLARLPHRERHICVLTAGELLQGVRFLPTGRRRDRVHAGVEGVLRAFADRVVDVDARTAPYFAEVRARRRQVGLPIDVTDSWIAAVCRRYDVPLATRNVKDFDGTGIAVVNPWDGL